jgi:hypothetical protein
MVVACSEQATAPRQETAALKPQFGLQGNNSGGLIWRGDSNVTLAQIYWTEGSLQRFLYFSEGMADQRRATSVFYGTYREEPCDWDPFQACPVWLSLGYGSVPTQDIRGGGANFTLETNTSPASNPDFYHENDPGGWIQATVRAVPGAPVKTHSTGSFEWDGMLFTYNVMLRDRAATVSGTMFGVPIPASASVHLYHTTGHMMTLLKR